MEFFDFCQDFVFDNYHRIIIRNQIKNCIFKRKIETFVTIGILLQKKNPDRVAIDFSVARNNFLRAHSKWVDITWRYRIILDINYSLFLY